MTAEVVGQPTSLRTVERAVLAIAACALGLALCNAGVAARQYSPVLSYRALPTIPATDFGGMFAGVSGGVLVAAGGTDGVHWSKDIYVLDRPSGQWRKTEISLPRAISHGASATWGDSLICIGGLDAEQCYADVIRLRWSSDSVDVSQFPPLPAPCAHAAAIVIGNVLYVAGGISRPGGEARSIFWALDLSAEPEKMRWLELEPWPGTERFDAVAGTQGGRFFLFGGLARTSDGANPLKDAYVCSPDLKSARVAWRRIADLPYPVAAAPAPALTLGQSHVGLLAQPGLEDAPTSRPCDLLLYHTVTDAWAQKESLPAGAAARHSVVVAWLDGWAVVGGEGKDPSGASPVWLTPAPKRLDFRMLDWLVVAIYMAGMLWIGFYFSRREKTTSDYFVGGRRIPWWVAGLAIFGTQASAISVMAVPAVVFATDWVRVVGTWMYLLLVPLVTSCFLPFFRRLKSASGYEYLERRFSLPVRVFSSAVFILAQVGRYAVVLYLPSLLLSGVTGVNVYFCILLLGIITIIYVVLGGMEAVVWTDVLQVVVLFGGVLLCLGVIVYDSGGIGEVLRVAHAHGKMRVFHWGWDPTQMVVWVMVLGNATYVLMGYSADQTYIQRYMITRDEKSAARGLWTNGLISAITGPVWFLLGTALFVFYKKHPEALNPGLNDEIVPWFIAQELPIGISGLVISGIFAAAMSTLDGAMHCSATAYVEDFHRRLIRNDMSEEEGVRLARRVVAILGILGTGLAMLLATVRKLMIFDLYMLVMGLLAGAICGVFVLAVFTRRTHAWGALVGVLAGAAIPAIVMKTTRVNFYLYSTIGVAATVTAGYLASMAIPGKNPDLAGLTLFTMEKSDA